MILFVQKNPSVCPLSLWKQVDYNHKSENENHFHQIVRSGGVSSHGHVEEAIWSCICTYQYPLHITLMKRWHE